ncbi:UME6 C6 zinc finger URS1-binding protein-like protein [Scheffersomyces amazonensis]|uniref:UME6 C6 zinc finger URS1-binding protein-like protein n=1 Tax=Scheffersomyces amazonensis TaxID=1078765 RepID=UPI00315DE363
MYTVRTSTDTPSSATFDNEDTIRLNSSMITSSPIVPNQKFEQIPVKSQQHLFPQNSQLDLHQQSAQQQLQHQYLNQQQQQSSTILQHQHTNQNQQQQLSSNNHFSQLDVNDQDLYQFENLGQFNPLPPPPISINKSTASPSYSNNSNSSYGYSPTSGTSLANNNTTKYYPSVATSDTSSHILLHDEEELQTNTTNYSFFSHVNMINSSQSLPLHSNHNKLMNNNINIGGNSIFKLQIESSSDLLEPTVPDNTSAELMYNLTEFDVGNPSFDSIPDSIIYSNNNTTLNSNSNNLTNNTHVMNNSNVLGSFNDTNNMTYSNQPPSAELSQFPYTPTLSDVYTPTFSDSSFTPNSTVAANPNYPPSGTFEDHGLRIQTPHYSNNSTNNSFHKVSKKPSLSRINSSINSKKNLIIHTHLAGSASNLSTSTPMKESSPKISPLTNKYRGLDINISNPSLRSFSNQSNSSTTSSNSAYPPMNLFRHNSDSSTTSSIVRNSDTSSVNASSLSTATNTPRRKTYPNLNEISLKKSKKHIKRMVSKDSLIMKDKSKNSSKESVNSLSSEDQNDAEAKPKKYTRRRLLPRSKNGCWICRIKHLKCDEVRPNCSSCLKFGIHCDYSKDKPDYVTDKQLRKEKLEELSTVRKQNQAAFKHQKNKIKSDFNDQFQRVQPEQSYLPKVNYFS